MFVCFLVMTGGALGQLTMPAKGWKLIEKGEGKKEMTKRVIQGIEAIKVPPTIKIDPDLKPSAPAQQKANQGNQIVVTIHENGTFEMEGKELGVQGVEAVLKDRFRKIGEVAVLRIRADKGVEFKYVQRVIKAGLRVGLKKVAYVVFQKEDEKEGK